MDTKKLTARLVRALTNEQEEYQAFFRKKLEEHGVNSPKELSEDEKKKFFTEVEEGWTKDKNASARHASDVRVNRPKLSKAVLAFAEYVTGNTDEALADLMVLRNVTIIEPQVVGETFGIEVIHADVRSAVKLALRKTMAGVMPIRILRICGEAFGDFLVSPIDGFMQLKKIAKKVKFAPAEGVDVEELKDALFVKVKQILKQRLQ
jgi:hypothetical protein